MSFTEMLTEVEKLTAEERRELLKALSEAERQDRLAKNEEKPFQTIFDVAPHLVGAVSSGKGDLSTNKKYMEDFGK